MGWFTITIIVMVFMTLLAYPLVQRFGRPGFSIGAAVLGIIFLSYLPYLPNVLHGETYTETLSWLPNLQLDWVLHVDTLSLSMALLVTGAGALILWYSRWYFHKHDTSIARFHFSFVAFAVSMLGLVLSDNLYILFMFWELTTVFSFLLVAHNHTLRIARSAAQQALVVTTFGGLAMLIGFILLTVESGTASLEHLIQDPPGAGPLLTTSLFLIATGALSKSAIFPFHFWLPGAMAAPTPVSAYLHAAAMVKAGIYLIARLIPTYGPLVPGLNTTLVLLGGLTMVWGGLRAIRQFDLKLLIAHSTVSQLGMLIMLFGIGTPDAEYAALILLFAHALAKAPLFLTVGIIDHCTGERDIRKLSGLGRQFPVLATIGTLAAASLAGLPVFIGFVGKETALTALYRDAHPGALNTFATFMFIVGSALTVAYMLRYVWGAYGTPANTPATRKLSPLRNWILIGPAIFALAAGVGGPFSPLLEEWLQEMSEFGAHLRLGLWHGVTPELLTTCAIIAAGVLIYLFVRRNEAQLPLLPESTSASHLYWRLTYGLDSLAVKTTATTQRGSLPFYLVTIFMSLIISLGTLFFVTDVWPTEYVFYTLWAQIPIAVIMIAAAMRAARSTTRFKAVVLVGVTGYGMVAIFALHGAPDLAVTQALVETITLIAFILVIRRLPINISVKPSRRIKAIRIAIAVSLSLGFGFLALISLNARTATPISDFFAELAVEGGHGANIVNVTLVDIRGWDTMGELSVVLAAATGIASLIFLNTRGDNLPKLSRKAARTSIRDHLHKIADPDDPTSRAEWTLAGFKLMPENRSIVLEVVVRLIFHALILVSVYLLLAGHNAPGGGFAAGLVAGLALVARYLAGGRHELGATVTLDAGRILGVGLILATGTALVPMFFGQQALASTWFEIPLGPLGDITFVTSTIFDIGVYLVVFGLMLDVLRSLGAEIDEQEEEDALEDIQEGTLT